MEPPTNKYRRGVDAPTERCDLTFDRSPRHPSVLKGISMPSSLRSSAHFIPHHERTAGAGSVMNDAVLNKLERRLVGCTPNCVWESRWITRPRFLVRESIFFILRTGI